MTIQIFLLSIFLFIVYIFLYSALPFLFAFAFTGKDIYKKVKVFLLTFSFPIIFFIVIFFDKTSNNRFFDILIIGTLILATSLRIKFSNKKYLTKFCFGEQNLTIEYLTPLLKTKAINLSIDDINEFKILKANWLVEYPASININYKQSWLTFELIDKKLKESIKNQITAANKAASWA